MNDIDYYYSEEQQEMIQKEFKNYQMNSNLNEMMLDLHGRRYRISFSEKKQINTVSKNERPIKMNVICLT